MLERKIQKMVQKMKLIFTCLLKEIFPIKVFFFTGLSKKLLMRETM